MFIKCNTIDLTIPFSTPSPLDVPYEVHTKVPIKSNSHTLVFAMDNEGGSIYFFGGFRVSGGNSIYRYSIKLDGWTEVTPVNGVIMPSESTTRVIGVKDSSNNNIYIFDNSTMYIYDALKKSLHISLDSAPYKIYYYATVMLNTGVIAYIGGSKAPNGNMSNIPMNEILTYDTYLSKWDIKNATVAHGTIPVPRQGHSASIAPDGRIFVYGGYDGNDNAIELNGSYPIFAVLELVSNEFVWSIPELIGLAGQNKTNGRMSTIDLIDISNRDIYKFVTDFTPQGYVPPVPSSSSPPSSPSLNNIIIATVIGSVVGLVVVGWNLKIIDRLTHIIK
ncbi:hypothetical protein RhiirA5_369985 [Rhizophagus irregularis]|uniref:Galactose oxidase n=1 Tax=Rhizophagus irregularis TaxID=588596 RepID=A0A2N0QB12_9GLOM|nr:hypothetical protein RhiirA5_369985 [Rhizophagus irregularis]